MPTRSPTDSRELVLHAVEDGVATLTLNRPARLNAWTSPLAERYFELLTEVDEDERVRAIVVTGAGRGFCAGADMDVLQGRGDGVSSAAAQRPQTFPLSIRKPIVAAINGPCAGIGFVMALMCDIRFAAAGAKFTTAFSRRGLVAEHGCSWMLPRLVGPARALDLLLSARVFLAEEALELGVVNRVLPGDQLLSEAVAYARDLGRFCSPAAMADIKQQVYRAYEQDLETATNEAAALMVASFARPDFREGVGSFVQKRDPAFPPLPKRGR